MTGLQWTNAVVLAAAVTMATMMGVVCLLYGLYLDEAPQLREGWPLLTRTALTFTVIAAVSALAFFGVLRNKAWRWYGEAALALTLAGACWQLWLSLTGL